MQEPGSTSGHTRLPVVLLFHLHRGYTTIKGKNCIPLLKNGLQDGVLLWQ